MFRLSKDSLLLVGTGKTVMSSFVVETLLARDDVYVAYYYFEFTSPSTLSEEALLRSLVCQLSAASPAVLRNFYQKHNKGGLQPQLSTLQATLNELVAASKKPVFIVIDALDELPVTQRKYLLQSLVTFSASKSASGIHVMVTSREEVDIHRAFEEKVDFELGVQGDLVRQDIAAFVDRELEAAKWRLWPRDTIQLARRLLNERADGQFRMVACQVDILHQVKTYERLEEALRSLPKTLSATYDYILGKIPEDLRHQAHRLFTILSFDSSPIWIHDLSAQLAVDFGNEDDPTQLPTLREEALFVDPLDIVDLGASLVSRVDHPGGTSLQLAHASVKEHFLVPYNAWFSLSEDHAHSVIARCCLALFIKFGVLEQKSKFTDSVSYSISSWSRHVLPNGPLQLLRQQHYLYTFFPWQHIRIEYDDEQLEVSSSLASAAFLGLVDLVKTFLDTRRWAEGDMTNALAAAAASEREKAIKMQCFHTLLESGVNVNAFTNAGSPLYHASKVGDLELVQKLIEMEADVNASGERCGSVLQAGATSGELKVVRFLIDNGADVDGGEGEYGSVLQAGVLSGNIEMVQLLVGEGADVNEGGGSYGSPLHAGAAIESLEIVRFLVEQGADVNADEGDEGSPLQAGASTGNLEIIRFLVENKADVNADEGYYGSALQAGAHSGNLEVVRFLVENRADVNAGGGKYGSALQAASFCYNGLAVVRFLVENGADVNAGGGYYGSALKAGAHWGKLEVVHFLVENKADVNAGGGTYGSALQAASYGYSNMAVVRFLIARGADINANGGHYGSALQAASCAHSGSLAVVRLLVAKGADVNAGGGHYGSALQAGASAGQFEIVCFLVENKADVNAGGGEYGSALQAGAFSGRLDIVRFLVENGADVNAEGGYYGSALQAGAHSGTLEVVRFLVENGAQVNAGGGYFGSALQAASCARTEGLAVVRFLVDKGADVNACGGYFGSAIQAGADSGELEIVCFLVECGANVNASGGNYGSALQAGAYSGKVEIVHFLVEKGAYMNAIGGEHKTALDAAQSQCFGILTERHEIVQFLKSCGAKTWEEMTDLSNDVWEDMEAWGWPPQWNPWWSSK
ncbi:ankyrin repeat-containing domain protein [Flagelloscypha sp. PMI_526]|nr:ankyrin repeat-containing domain protein [Flagelloscypha sp. PMI_526]